MTRPRIYISGPLTSSGNVLENVAAAIRATRALIDAGFSPFCPHLSYQVDPAGDYPHGLWMAVDLPWLDAAEALLRLPGESLGADIEVARALDLGIPVFQTIGALVEHFTAAVV